MQQSIDWFSWLSKTGLEPSLIYEYGMTFLQNELEEDDIAYFNHEFLQSMGISIAKHRLEILKLARKQKGFIGSHPISKLVIAVKNTKRTLASYIRTWAHQDDSALVVVHKDYGSRWKSNMLKRSKRFVTFKQSTPTLLLTDGCHKSDSARLDNLSSSLIYRYDQEKMGHGNGDDHAAFDDKDGGGVGYWSGGGVKEIRWDAMFQNLKPT